MCGTISNSAKAPVTKKFKAKELHVLLGKFYSVALLEATPAGSVERQFHIKHKSSALTSEMIVALLRNYNQIVKLPSALQKEVILENNIKTAGELHAISSVHLIEPVAYNTKGSKDNVDGGKYGNVSIAYLTPRYGDVFSEMCTGLGLKENFKLLSDAQIKVLDNATAYMLFDKDDELDILGVELKHLPMDILDATIKSYLSKGYTPARLLFYEITPGEANLFNVGAVHRLLKDEIDAETTSYFVKTGDTVLALTNAELKTLYGVNMPDHIDGHVGRSTFRCQVDHTGRLRKVYLIEKEAIYFAKPSADRGPIRFDRTSTVQNYLRLKANTQFILANTPSGLRYDVEIEKLTLDTILRRTNYYKFSALNAVRAGDTSTNPYEHLLDQLSVKTSEILQKTHASSLFTSDEVDDQRLIHRLKKLANEPHAFFDIIGYGYAHNNLSDKFIQFRTVLNIGATVRVKPRYKNTESNDNQAVLYASMHKCTLSFEREKMYTVLFVSAMIAWLKENGHTHIVVEMEENVNKHSGGQGFLDCIVTSQKNGTYYGQVFEFKSWQSFNLPAQAKLQAQCSDYDIADVINARHATYTYTGCNILDVVGVNLRLDEVQCIGSTTLPWLLNGKWPEAMFGSSKTKTKTSGISSTDVSAQAACPIPLAA